MRKILISMVFLMAFWPEPTQGQTLADSTDTHEVDPQSGVVWSEVITPEGQKVEAYFSFNPGGIKKRMYFYYTNPERRPRPQVKVISVDKIHCMTQQGRYSEVLKLKGKSIHVLVPRVVDGPGTELFMYAEPKAIPIPLLVTFIFIPYTKTHWYLRRDQQLLEVRRGKFSEQIADYVQDAPELAQKVRTRADGHRYQNTPSIISEYNRYRTTNH